MILYRTVEKEAEAEQIIEKSRFIAHIKSVETREEAEQFISAVRTRHRAATHNVPAMVLGDKFQVQWASDDGEPQGTSGAPIVQMLVKEGITNTVIVVTRYFGGIKLGTGGLVRAYTGTAKLVLEQAGICEVMEMNIFHIRTDYTYLARLKNMAAEGKYQVQDIGYEDSVILNIAVEPEDKEAAKTLITNVTGGRIQIIEERKEFVKKLCKNELFF